ncbi:SpoIIE family protein phosphatase [bacterium]|nr:SpoIIE family protein phosphatase [bacterium]
MHGEDLLAQVDSNRVLNALADGVYVTDRDRRIIFWSKGAERITGWTPEEVVGRACHENILVHKDKDDHCLCGQEFCPLYRAMESGCFSDVPIILFARTKAGYRIPLQVTVAPIHDDAGEVIGGVEVFREAGTFLRDLQQARLIQDNAMRSQLPVDERVRFLIHHVPMEYVGGDFYRIEQIDEDRYGMILADVMGHGVAASLYTMHLRALWEQHRDLMPDPRTFFQRLNFGLKELVGEDHYFATAFYGVLNVATGELKYVGAGHPAPFLWRAAEDGHIEPLRTDGLPIGLLREFQYENHEMQLEHGDSLLLYSDGAAEVSNRDGVPLGEDGLMEIARWMNLKPRSDALEKLEAELLHYSNFVRLPDDLTLMLVHWNGSAAE